MKKRNDRKGRAAAVETARAESPCDTAGLAPRAQDREAAPMERTPRAQDGEAAPMGLAPRAQDGEAVVVDAAAYESARAAHLSSQYRRAEGARGAFVREAVAFGAMMIGAERELGYFVTAVTKYKTYQNCKESNKNDKKGRWGEGRANSGLEGWLAEHCPEINYNTAKVYKSMAAKMVAMMGGESAEVLAALRSPHELAVDCAADGAAAAEPCADCAETVDAEIIEARERLFTEATSRRKLEQLWFSFTGQGPVGRPRGTSGTAGRRAATAEERAADAEALTRETLGRVTSYLAGAWIETVAPETRDDFVRTLRDCADLAEERARRAAR